MRFVVLLALVACGGDTVVGPTRPFNAPPVSSSYGQTDDGRLIVWMDEPVWCAQDGSGGGICGDDIAKCEHNAEMARAQGLEAKLCRQFSSVACSVQKHTVSGRVIKFCYVSVRDCDLLAANAIQTRQATGAPDCAVYRMRDQ